jgi:DNA-nicking Smr family endonuclease
MPRPRTLSEADRQDWSRYTNDIDPLDQPKKNRKSNPTASAPIRRPAPVVDIVVGERGLGVDDSSWRALGNGRLAPARRLDLHGHTANAALAALQSFLHRASADRLRCVEIITGRGTGETGGVLRRELPHWLNRADLRPLIIAVQHPQPGNLGSVRILLKRKKAFTTRSTRAIRGRNNG